MRILLILLALFPFSITQAQNDEKNIELEWEITSLFSPDGREKKVLGFRGAVYPDWENPIPYYLEIRLQGSANRNFSGTLLNPVFTPLNQEESNLVKNLTINSSINITTTPRIERKKAFQEIRFVPIRKNPQTGAIEKLIKFGIRLRTNTNNSALKTTKSKSYLSESVLKSGKWIKIAVDTTAFYKITYEQLKDMGIAQPENVRIYGSGGGMLPKMNNANHPDDLPMNSVWFQKGGDGIFNSGDFLLFFAKGPRNWSFDREIQEFVHENHSYSDASYYFLTSDKGSSPTPANIDATTGSFNQTVTQFDDYRVIDKDQKNLLQSGRLWVGETFDITTNHSFSFKFPNLIKDQKIKISTHLLARASSATKFLVKGQGNQIGTVNLSAINGSSYTSKYADDKIAFFSNYNAPGDNFTIDLEYQKNSASSKGWLNYLRINARIKLVMTSDQMAFRSIETIGIGNKSRFVLQNTTSNHLLFDVTNPQNIIRVQPKHTGNTTEFIANTSSLREFVALNPNGNFPTPKLVGEIPNQNLHGLTGRDYIIVCPKKFMGYAAQLADLHRTHDQLKVTIVEPNQIYNEFSSGARDIAAIRNFMRMLYDRSASEKDMPKYLLLFGDGSYDNKLESSQNTNQIPTYQSSNSLSPTQSFVTDDFFGLLDEDEGEAIGLVDIGIGRLPVNTPEEAQTVVQKILGYAQNSSYGDWRSKICFVGDDEDNNLHMRDANLLALSVEKNHPEFRTQRIFLDDYQQETTSAGQAYPEVNRLITENINKGTLILNYTGHGNENGLAHEHILTIDDILNWQNKERLPLFMTATCEFSRFDNYKKTSAGELILLRNGGGGIGLFSTTRLVFSSQNFLLNRSFYDAVFERNTQGEFYRLGDIMRLTKRASGSGDNKRNFCLLGDPALRLKYPEHRITTLKLNNIDISQPIDTLKALSKITISGQLEDGSGKLLPQFQGTIFPTVFDKKMEKSTLGNDDVPFQYEAQNQILFKGKASVRKGKFSFTFMVPKDINYQFGPGKISYYASSSNSDAAGYNTSIIVGGSNPASINDKEGPEIDLYMNDEQFAPGGITDPNPMLLAVVQDSSGINTVGSAIGHNITAILDNQSEQEIQLNDHYESELDNYQKGKITYQFTDLAEGEHQLRLKVWDNVNNSSETELDFIVAESAELAIKHVLNYPNPFTTNTGFYFEHNMPHKELDILIQILTVSGRMVKTIETSLIPEGFRIGPIRWDGRDDFGNRIGKGVYFYRLQVRDKEGKTVNKFQKLVLLK
ncbi:MAG: type IX secretion system sortase PorU [Marinifilaceae bacterium]